MKLAKSLLLGSAAAFVATTGYAADLPSTKAAPVTYVKVCDAYGAGFFYIPGTDTCIKVGGRVRADYSMSGKQDVYTSNVPTSYYNSTTGAVVNGIGLTSGGVAINALNGINSSAKPSSSALTYLPNGVAAGAQNTYGWEARGRVDLDARSQTAYGTVQAVASIRLARTTGVLDQSGPALSSSGAGATLEASYIRFAGFTFGAAKDHFSFMPSTFYGAGHWSSFANGAKQLAYTAVLGGGFSATVAIQDAADTTAGGLNTAVAVNRATGAPVFAADFTAFGIAYTGAPAPYAHKEMPQVNARIDFDQSWGTISVMGAVGKAANVSADAVTTNLDATTWAAGIAAKINLPMLAAGDVLYLNAAVADGMT